MRNNLVTRLSPGCADRVLALFYVKVNEQNLQNLARTGEHASHSLRARLSRWVQHTLELFNSSSADGYEIYMRCPGERVPSPPAESGPRWRFGQDNWVLAA